MLKEILDFFYFGDHQCIKATEKEKGIECFSSS